MNQKRRILVTDFLMGNVQVCVSPCALIFVFFARSNGFSSYKMITMTIWTFSLIIKSSYVALGRNIRIPFNSPHKKSIPPKPVSN